VQVVIELWEHDSTSPNDHFDINPNPSARNLTIGFKPKTFTMTMNVAGFETYRCIPGQIRVRGLNGEDRAEVIFALSASFAGAPNGDSDGDGLLDGAEVCGLDADLDGAVDVDLPGLGADPARKDAFVEIDWMVNDTGIPATQHTHEPWLPALMIAWNEFNAAPITNPTRAGVPSPSGIALHVDVGTLYANYALDFDGDGVAELGVNAAGNVDVNGDGIVDIGDLASIGTGTPGGGNSLPEDPSLTADGSGDFFAAGSDFGAIKATNFQSSRDLVFHYAVFGDQYPSVPVGSSGLAEGCGQLACNDFFVTLGVGAGWSRQTVDADRDGFPDAAGALMAGTSALPVDGSIAEQAGSFIHELGHNLGLDHGGGDSINYKPNYLSVMNYLWQISGLTFDFDGDLLVDRVGVDFDGDGVIDSSRFMYSNPALPNLQENGGLNEPAGIGDASTLSFYSCPPVGMPPVVLFRIPPGTGPIDWNCNRIATEVGVSADVNSKDGSGLTLLTGFDDANQIATVGLAFQAAAPGISPQELRDLRNRTQRIVPVLVKYGKDAYERCIKPKTIDFEDLGAGTEVTTQYAPLASFLKDELRTPKTIGPDERGGTPTSSPKISLRNELAKDGQPAPLVIELDPPQRQVSFYAGRARPSDVSARVVMQAFDVDGLNMGVVTAPLPSERDGVTAFLGTAAIFPDQLVKRIEIRYETFQRSLAVPTPGQWVMLAEPQQIDDLTLCQQLKSSKLPPALPPQPKFGDLKVNLLINAVMLVEGPAGDSETDHHRLVEHPLTAPIIYDGTAGLTDLAITRNEGTRVNLSAPTAAGRGHFLHWQLDGTVSFGEGQRDVAVALLRSGTMTAVYMDDKSHRPREPRCECPNECCADQEQH
jgi:hypothetical protein